MRVISLVFSLICFLEVIILFLHYRSDQTHRGFGWWTSAVFLIGLYFLTFFLPSFETLGVFQKNIIRNTALVASSLLIYISVLKFYDTNKTERNILFFIAAYVIISSFLYLIGNTLISGVFSALSIAVFFALTGRLLFQYKLNDIERFINFIAVTFLIASGFFLAYGFLKFVSPFALTTIADSIEELSSFFIFVTVTLWTMGFIVLTNQRVKDITNEARGKYDLIFNTIPDAVLITRLKDGLFVEINEGFTNLSGYTWEDVKGKTTLDIDIWYDPTERQKFVILLTDTGSVENMEFKFRRKNSKPLIGLLSARTIELNKELHILTVVHDITSRKKMEEKLRENEQKYRFLAENSVDVIWHINNSFRIDYISPADETTRGYKREEVLGQPIWNFFKPEGVKLIREKIEHQRQKGTVSDNTDITRFEVQQKCKDGTWIWTEICAAPHYNKGELIGYHGISRDITEKKQLLDELYHQATIDDLTRIPNRRHFMYLAEKEMKSAKRYHHPISIVVIDFDNLKQINDTYGHFAGDRALSVFARIVQQIIREVDILGRFGGDEFLILLPETSQEQAFRVMERINQVLDSSPIFYQDESFSLSVSSGIASIENWTDTLEDLLKRADAALYEVKENAQNGISTNKES
jgi:diguanylate cyclase (GGDEF)-like protein/PAS domain S-box-containing protein